MGIASTYPTRILATCLGLTSAGLVGQMAIREVLTADRTYYVRPDGNDANTGLTDTSGAAFLTGVGAMNALASRIDFNGKKVTLQFLTATVFNGRNVVPKMLGQKQTGDLVLYCTTPSGATLRNAGGYQPAVEANYGAMCTIVNLKLSAPTNGYGANASEGAVIDIGSGVEFGDCTGGYHVYAVNSGTINFFPGANPIKITGPANAFYCAGLNGNLYCSGVTIDGGGLALAFPFGFAACIINGVFQANGNTFTNCGSFTGARYALQKGGRIETFGSGASYFPGSSAGTNDGTGSYG